MGQEEYNLEKSQHSKSKSQSQRCMTGFAVVLFLGMAACIIALAILLIRKDDHVDGNYTTVPPPTDGSEDIPKSATGSYRYAAVAADAELCSQIGTNILAEQGGSTVDAAIAALLCLGVVHPQSMGIGGGFFMTVYDKSTNKAMCLNSREVAPLAATEEMYINNTGSSTTGGLAVAVPGEIAGYAEAHARYGKLPWAALFEPTIRLCEEGIPVTQTFHNVMQSRIDTIKERPMLRETFLKAGGEPYGPGELLLRPKLAVTLRRIAEGGAGVFYNGSLTDQIVQEIQQDGGIITAADLNTYKPEWKDPVSVTLNNGGYTMYGPPPPSSEVIIQYILSILDGYNISSRDIATKESHDLLMHRLVEAMKFGYAARSYLGDEDFVNVTELVELWTTKSYSTETRLKINDSTTLKLEDYGAAFYMTNDAGTSHLSVYGPDGSAVAVTSTVNLYFGSKLMGSATGIIYNDEMDDFSTPGIPNSFGFLPSKSNFIVPGKRPQSSMSPTIMTDQNNNVKLIAGASGGTNIISGTLQAIINTLWLDYNVTAAVDAARVRHQLVPEHIDWESHFPSELRPGLVKRGHVFNNRSSSGGVVQMIYNACDVETSASLQYNGYCINAVSDVRKGGAPDGY